MARDLGARHREAHGAEEPALPALADVTLGVVVRRGRRGADDVEAELVPYQRAARRASCDDGAMLAARIHEDGGPEVLRVEEVPDPVPGAGEVLVRLRAASLNHLDVWVREACRRCRSRGSSARTVRA